MGNIDKYCPACGSDKVFTIEINFEPDNDLDLILEVESEALWYECGDCHSEWQNHSHQATHGIHGHG